MVRYNRPNASMSDADFKRAVAAKWSKNESKQFAIIAGTFTNDSPDTNSVTWASCVAEYGGETYDITDGNTSDKYIYWELTTPTVFAHAAAIPSITEDLIIIGINTSGAFKSSWKAGQAAVVANTVSAGAIDGMTITGALIQTEATADRGIKQTSTALTGYSATGTETFSLTASTGALAINGGTITGPTIQTDSSPNDRIELTSASGLRGIEDASTVNTQLTVSGQLKLKQLYSLDNNTKIDFTTEDKIYFDLDVSSLGSLYFGEASGDLVISPTSVGRGSDPYNLKIFVHNDAELKLIANNTTAYVIVSGTDDEVKILGGKFINTPIATDDISFSTNGKGMILKNSAGTVTKRVRLNDAGDGLVFETP